MSSHGSLGPSNRDVLDSGFLDGTDEAAPQPVAVDLEIRERGIGGEPSERRTLSVGL